MMEEEIGDKLDKCEEMMKIHCCNLFTGEATKSVAKF